MPMLKTDREQWLRYHRPMIVSTAGAFGVTFEMVLGRSRTFTVCRARDAVMTKLREQGLSYPEIGTLLGRDHTTVMAGVRRFEERAKKPIPDAPIVFVPTLVDDTLRVA